MKELLIGFFLLSVILINAQTPIPEKGEVFKDNVLPRVDILISQASLDYILASANQNSNQEFEATFIFDNGTVRDTVPQVGFRLRGNTSRGAKKKSFKVSFNTFISGRKYQDLEKMNLNGEHNDPSISRSKTCWDLLRKMEIPATRANHVELYINGNYYGLYINVEHIDEEFVDLRFGNKDGNLYKCLWGSDFTYINSNPATYDNGVYNLQTNKTENDFTDLMEFITVLNNEPLATLPCELEKVFNIDSYLKVMAFDVLTGNWDGPLWNKNNCYLYKNTATGKFEYIPYDVDNTLGVSWFPNIDWGARNIYQWGGDWEARPLYDRILAVQEYKDRYSYYMNELLQTFWNTTTFYTEIDQMKALIDNAAINDTYRTLDYGFSVQDYHNSFTQSVNFHTPYGLKDYIAAREQTANNQLILNNIKPVISNIESDISIENQQVKIKTKVFDNQNTLTVDVWYSENGGVFMSTSLFDDGNHNDEQANDGIYGGTIDLTISTGSVQYYISATDSQNEISRYPRCEEISFEFNPQLPKLVINELMASNDAAHADENDEFDDWIEIYNADNVSISLKNLYLSDNPNNPIKWQFPDITLAPDDYLVVWADEDGEQGSLHANFKLSKSGEKLGIYSNVDNGYAPLDVIDYPVQTTDISYGRLPNGSGEFQELSFISPNENNEDTAIIVVEPPRIPNGIELYPNPFSEVVNINHPYENPSLRIYNSIGALVFSDTEIASDYIWNGTNQNGVFLPSGVYLISLLEKNNNGKWRVADTKKVVIFRK